jgi:hydrogenase nickel incorporation protein HypB
MVSTALNRLPLANLDVLIVENVGNLICPASFALGTHSTVLVASVPEGDDKPYKYPRTYRGVDVLVVNKTDLLPYVSFDMKRFRRGVEALNEGIATFEMSCRTGEGVAAFAEWVTSRAAKGAVAR